MISDYCAAVGFGDGITSANVVGYAQNNLRDGSIGLVPQFLGVGVADGGVNIQDIKCTAGCEGQIQFTILDSIGIDGDSYIWDYSNDGELCWVDGAYDKVVGMQVEPGQGLWVQAENETQYIIFPGVEL